MIEVSGPLGKVESVLVECECVPGFRCRLSDAWHKSVGNTFWCGVSGFGFSVSGFGFRFSGFGFQFSGFRFRVSGFGFQFLSVRFRARALTRAASVAHFERLEPSSLKVSAFRNVSRTSSAISPIVK